MRIRPFLLVSLLVVLAAAIPAQAFAQTGFGCRRAPIYSAFKCYHFDGGCGPEALPNTGTIWFRVRCEDRSVTPTPPVITYSDPWPLLVPTIWSADARLDTFLANVPLNLGGDYDIARNGCSEATGFVLYWPLNAWSAGQLYCLEYNTVAALGGAPPPPGDAGWTGAYAFIAPPAGAAGAGGSCYEFARGAQTHPAGSGGFLGVGGFYLPEPVPEYFSSPGPGRPDIYTTGGDGPELANCTVVYGNGTEGSFEDASRGPDWGGWTGYDASADYLHGPLAPAGDFSKLFPVLYDIDPGAENGSAQATFIDDGSHTNNPPTGSTGGQSSVQWTYGPSGYVVNYSGGLAPPKRLRNEIWSPPIAWPYGSGGVDTWLEYEIMSHLPLANGQFEMWAIRSSTDGGSSWGPWLSHGQASYSEEPRYSMRRIDVSTLVEAGATHVQISLGVHQLDELFDLPGGDATPGPWYDNVRLLACNSGNWPVAAARPADLWRDGWPASGLGPADSMDPADMRIDLHAGRDLSWGSSSSIDYDSRIRVRARATTPGASITSATLYWRLQPSPAFGPSVRPGLAGVTDLGGGLYEGSSSPASVEQIAPGLFEYAYDQPAEPEGFYPGDWFFYAFEFQDSGGGVCWLPDGGISGAGGGAGSHPGGFTARGLPSVYDGAGNHARILVWDNSGEPDELATARRAMGELGYVENVDYDVYQSRQPTALRSGDSRVQLNQIGGYDCIVFLAGATPAGAPMGNGGGPQFDDDDAADLLLAWHQLPGPRTAFHFGDHIAEGLTGTFGGQNYLDTILSAEFVDRDVGNEIGSDYAPTVDGTTASMVGEFAVTGADPRYPERDSIRPLSPATAAWHYEQGGAPGAVPAGSWHVWSDGVDPRHDALLPFALRRVSTPVEGGGSPPPVTAAARLLEELFAAAGRTGGGGPSVGDLPTNPTRLAAEAWPNPFNPQLTVKVWAPGDGPLRVRLLDLRGRELAVLHDGPTAGPRWLELGWDARDAGGRPLPSGVYLYESAGFGQRLSGKVVLVR